MGMEIERKFLIINDQWRDRVTSHYAMKQGYLASEPSCSIRIRLTADKAFLNIKGATLSVTRTEFEYPIPFSDGQQLLQFCRKPLIEKTRYLVEHNDQVWEVDVFEGDNAGLVVAEIELDDEGQSFVKPAWAGEEVSHDKRYYNVCLVEHPFKDWAT